jgi:hypothetical protein
LVPEAVATEDTAMGSLPLFTVNALAKAVVVERFSLYVRVMVVPAAVLATDAYTGGTPTGVTEDDAVDAEEVASELVAVAVNVYGEPFARPVITHDPEEPVTVQNFSGNSTAVIVNFVGTAPLG